MAERLAALPALYKDLGDRFRKLNIPANRIYISQYFDSTRDKQGKTCDPLITTVQWSKGELGAAKTDPKTGKVITPAQKTGVAKPSGGVQRFSKREAIFASQDVLEPLNLAVARAAKSNRWQLISGAAQSFHTHGYCSDGALDRRRLRVAQQPARRLRDAARKQVRPRQCRRACPRRAETRSLPAREAETAKVGHSLARP